MLAGLVPPTPDKTANMLIYVRASLFHVKKVNLLRTSTDTTLATDNKFKPNQCDEPTSIHVHID